MSTCATKLPRLLSLLLALILLAGGFGSAARAQSDGFPRTVLDLTGAPVTLPARPARVLVVGPDPVLAHLLPAAERVTLAPTADPAALAESGADLLVIPAGYATAFPGWSAAADAAGVPVFRTTPVTSLDGWRTALTRLGDATGREGKARAVLAHLEQRLARLRQRLAGQDTPRVLALTPEGYTFGQGTLLTDLIAAAGGLNAAADAGYADYRQVDDRAIHALAPEVVLLTPAWGASGRETFAALPAYADLPAVRAGRVLLLPFSPTAPADPAAAVLILALLLHPAALLTPLP